MAEFYNGGTALAGRTLYQAATSPKLGGPALFRSKAGLHWQLVSPLPTAPASEPWRTYASDFSLQRSSRGLIAYFAGRPGPSGADIGRVRRLARGWGPFARVLVREPGTWDGLDLGEPDVFRARRRTYMLYGGLGSNEGPRQIGLAFQTSTGWHRCEQPFIPAGGATFERNVLDPDALVQGRRLYVFYGGGTHLSLGGDMNGVIVVRAYRLR